jgi:hypothetical protein
MRSMSAFRGSFRAEFRWISPRPSAHDKHGANNDVHSRHAISFTRGIVTDIFSPRIPSASG